MQILSFQSAVAFGHVGNRAAVFPLQRLGFDVWPVDTVVLSNHPGHGGCGGGALPDSHLTSVAEGLERLGIPAACDGFLSGYLGEASAAEPLIRLLKSARPGAVYLCDPVMGDDGPGLYVKPDIPEAMRERLLPLAQAATPNRFELELLTGLPARSMAETLAAARALMALGPKLVAVTSLPGAKDGMVACLAATLDEAWVVETPLLSFPIAPNGAGDLFSALLLAGMLRGEAPPQALALAVSRLFSVLEETQAQGLRELALTASQDLMVRPRRLFAVDPVSA